MSTDTPSASGTGSHDAPTRPTTHTAEREVAEAIQNTRRRYVLYYLYKHDGSVGFQKLVDQVSTWESYPTDGEIPDSTRDSVYATLHQHHLPYLEERGLVRWDRETNRVECQLQDATWDLVLANDPRTTIRWHRVYLLGAALGLLVTGLAWAGVGPLGAVSGVVIAGAVTLVFVLLSVGHLYDVYRWNRRMEGMPPDFVISVDDSAPPNESDAEAGENDRC